MLQRHAIEKLHGDERMPILLADLVNRADVGMVQRRRRPRLAPEPLQRLRVVCNLIGQKFQRNKPAQRSILGLVHHAHPSAAQLLDECGSAKWSGRSCSGQNSEVGSVQAHLRHRPSPRQRSPGIGVTAFETAMLLISKQI